MILNRLFYSFIFSFFYISIITSICSCQGRSTAIVLPEPTASSVVRISNTLDTNVYWYFSFLNITSPEEIENIETNQPLVLQTNHHFMVYVGSNDVSYLLKWSNISGSNGHRIFITTAKPPIYDHYIEIISNNINERL